MSADIFSFKEDIYVAMAAPNSNSCVVMEWDHIEMNFRKFDNITGLPTHLRCFFFLKVSQSDNLEMIFSFKLPDTSYSLKHITVH